MSEVGTVFQIAGMSLVAIGNFGMFFSHGGDSMIAMSQTSHFGVLLFATGTVI